MADLTRINLLGINEEISREEIVDAFMENWQSGGFYSRMKCKRTSRRRVTLVGEFWNITESDIRSFLSSHHWSDGSRCAVNANNH